MIIKRLRLINLLLMIINRMRLLNMLMEAEDF